MIVRQTIEALGEYLESQRAQLVWRAPKIALIEVGLYEISGSDRPTYEVRCGRTEDNKFFVACNCKAGQFGKNACHHALLAFESHIAFMKSAKRAQERTRIQKEIRDNDKRNYGDSGSKTH